MKSTILGILRIHGGESLLTEFESAAGDWQIEIIPRPDGITFSRPLVISRNNLIVQLAHYTVSTYDTDYDPILEFRVEGDEWIPVSIYKFHTGLKIVGEDISSDEFDLMMQDWKTSLDDYADLTQACVKGRLPSKL
jgi:hypothetical protein